jgi:type IV pilus assembly protein PilM
MGGNLYTEEIQKQIGLSSEDAETGKLLAHESTNNQILNVIIKVNETITQEIRRSLDFYNSTASDNRISGVFVCGGCSKVYKLIDSISEKIGLPVEKLNPFAKIKYFEKDFDPEYLQEIAQFMAVPIGLAIRRVGDK